MVEQKLQDYKNFPNKKRVHLPFHVSPVPPPKNGFTGEKAKAVYEILDSLTHKPKPNANSRGDGGDDVYDDKTSNSYRIKKKKNKKSLLNSYDFTSTNNSISTSTPLSARTFISASTPFSASTFISSASYSQRIINNS